MDKFILFVFCILFSTPIFSQKKLIDSANEHFKNDEFAAAIPLYEAAEIGKNSINTLSKLAYSYRMNNRWQEAENLYKTIVEHERARSETFFYYGEALMSNEKYDEAKLWFEKYGEAEPDDPRTAVMIIACSEVKNITPYFENIEPIIFPQNSESDDNSAVFWNGGVVFTSDRPTGAKILKEKSNATGRDFLNLYFAPELDTLGSFDSPNGLSNKLSELNKNTGFASFSADSSMVFFTRNDNLLNRSNSYNLQLFSAEVDDNNFKKVRKLDFCSSDLNYMHPAISPDGNSLFFASDKPGGMGGTDLYVSIRNGEKWGVPTNLSEVVNSADNDGFPFMDQHRNLFFCSKGHVGFGGYDIFVTRQNPDGSWQKPINLGKPINSSLDDISFFIEKGHKRALFTSTRLGGDDDIFMINFQSTKGF